MFDDLLVSAASACREFRIPFGVGGVGRVGLENPTPRDFIVRCKALGAEWVILNRSFIDYRDHEDPASLRGFARLMSEIEELFQETSSISPALYRCS